MSYALAYADVPQSWPALPLESDLFGRVLWDCWQGRSREYYLRRDDNFCERDQSSRYFRPWEQMPAHHRCLLNHASGRVLDLGAGAGQHALVLQERGMAVTAVDASPLAVEVCRARGVRDARLMDATGVTCEERFDTILLMGNTLGIAGTPEGLHAWFTRLRQVIQPGGQILADIADYTATRDPGHLSYHRWNVARGRYPGSIRLRVEYDGHCSPAFDWLLMKLADLRTICAETGWRIERCVQVDSEATYAIGMRAE